MENPITVPVLHAWLLVVVFLKSLFLIVCIVLIEHLLPVEAYNQSVLVHVDLLVATRQV